MHKSIILIPAVFVADLLIKNKAEKKLKYGEDSPHLKGVVSFELLHNRGGFLNIGEDRPKKVRTTSRILTMLVALVYVYALLKGKNEPLKYTLALLLGGAWSNDYDRYERGYVVDYLKFKGLEKPVSRMIGPKKGRFVAGIVYNISDLCITLGTLFSIFFWGRSQF